MSDTLGSIIDKICILEKKVENKKQQINELFKNENVSFDENKLYDDHWVSTILCDSRYNVLINKMFKDEGTVLNEKYTTFVKILKEKVGEFVGLNGQIGWCIIELSKIINEGNKNERPLQFSKYKEYDKDVHTSAHKDLISTMTMLRAKNRDLWNLEDIRRNKSLSDEERLEAADQVAIENKTRNDLIDQIDELIVYYLNSRKVD